ncbi:MAG TPA: hypothetical protein PKC76_06175 [Saprospiraceae bacterium]|nr:hypothetical protein [Saprospiraceae bacterium]HMP23698.1 hypothetical protein [Saprospiraceae bacterium]
MSTTTIHILFRIFPIKAILIPFLFDVELGQLIRREAAPMRTTVILFLYSPDNQSNVAEIAAQYFSAQKSPAKVNALRDKFQIFWIL